MHQGQTHYPILKQMLPKSQEATVLHEFPSPVSKRTKQFLPRAGGVPAEPTTLKGGVAKEKSWKVDSFSVGKT